MSEVPENNSYQSLRLTLQRLEDQLTRRQEAYKREKAQLGGSKGADEYRLEESLKLYENDIGRLASKIDQIRQCLQGENLTTLSNCLVDIYAEAKQTVDSVFYQCIPSNSWIRSQPVPGDIKVLVNRLDKCSQSDTEAPYEPLIMFVGELLLRDDLHISGLQEWLANELAMLPEVLTTDECLDQIAAYQQEQQDVLSCFLVRVSEVVQKSAQDNQRVYSVRGWYIADIGQYRLNLGSAENVYLPKDTPDKPLTFKVDEIEPTVRKLITSCADKFSALPKSLHIFLPSELMDLPVDSWCSLPEEDPEETLGMSHEDGVFLRSNDRLSNRRVDRSKWKRRWELVQQCTSSSNQYFLLSDCTDISALNRQLRKKQNQRMFGVKLTTVPTPAGASKNHIFTLLSRSAMPSAVWLRQLQSGVTCEDCLNELLDSCSLQEIPGTVFDRRLDGDHIGQYLSLMWDDPYLLPPDFQYPQSA
ncbi:VMAP-C domain-containing protein [Leptothoe sp. PORK10 BA2]|uniref:VMAP-C domain-containing protein n=1 Tax=Leptothoe sp. PORK10 BA2 TaxID=3110254 RepID=UPI002B21806B|nr:hypothetical protein [Leptothoe sp. PORK10 BA2]MEA5464605.1 hypothetical protein [Leptothoe sp. PORK10 BA2]